MKLKSWQFCLLLLISPLFLTAQEVPVAIIADTFTAPVISPVLSCNTFTRDNKKIIIQWEVRDDSADYFTIERSVEGKIYEAIGILRSAEGILKYEFADEFPSRGQAYYRVKYTSREGAELYSQSSTIILPGSTSFRFYPNPADKLLIIRAEYPIELQVVDGFGKSRIAKSLGVGPQVVDVSFLEKGVYILRITDKTSGRQQFEKFLKN
ncbi:MAG TPA: T9SS type A sorting domain-containing protein [Chitinophagaceae bacterium]|nr:T9SS type A sorting domain-containing protein [Chitinophagaceae bacterium]